MPIAMKSANGLTQEQFRKAMKMIKESQTAELAKRDAAIANLEDRLVITQAKTVLTLLDDSRRTKVHSIRLIDKIERDIEATEYQIPKAIYVVASILAFLIGKVIMLGSTPAASWCFSIGVAIFTFAIVCLIQYTIYHRNDQLKMIISSVRHFIDSECDITDDDERTLSGYLFSATNSEFDFVVDDDNYCYSNEIETLLEDLDAIIEKLNSDEDDQSNDDKETSDTSEA